MPATPEELRRLLISLSSAAEADLAAVWSQLTPQTFYDALMDVMPALVGEYGDAAAAVTAEWYDEYRNDLNISGRFAADVPTDPKLGSEALAGWANTLAQENLDTALTRTSGGLVKRVMNAGRDAMLDNVERDPEAKGWQRKARSSGCAFCQMLAGRGLVFRTRSTADFASHDNCGCVCLPAFKGRAIPVRPYVPSTRNITDADRARVREWISKNG